MLKGYVFSQQIFPSEIFALFMNTFLNGVDGVSNNYLDGMELSYSGSNVTVSSGVVCIQGRFLGEDAYTTLNAGTNNLYCKLVIEVNLDNTNTASDFNQASYKIITSSSGYPNLTQNNIVKNNAGIYQYELARFQTTSNGITNFQDMRTFLDFESIYQIIQDEIDNIKNGSSFVPKSNFAVLTGTIPLTNGSGNVNTNYPTGFNSSNCVVISIGIDIMSNNYYTFNNSSSTSSIFEVRFSSENINIRVKSIDRIGTSNTKNYKLVLMKI